MEAQRRAAVPPLETDELEKLAQEDQVQPQRKCRLFDKRISSSFVRNPHTNEFPGLLAKYLDSASPKAAMAFWTRRNGHPGLG
jgi:hypothetical protein